MILLLLVEAGAALPAGDPSKPGAYCPFPKKGEAPQCFEEVEREYSDFFAAVDSGEVDSQPVADLERTLQTGTSESDRALAVSSLAYGYFLLARRAAEAERPDPALVSRLQSWNQLLGTVYEDADADSSVRVAVREAAVDLDSRAPAISVECDVDSSAEACQTTGLLLETLRAVDDPDRDSGVRGALGRLLGRMLPNEEPAEEAAEE